MVDTSVWINYFNQKSSEEVERLNEMLVKRENVLLGDLVLTEVLQGIRFKRESKQIHTDFDVLEVKELVGEEIARSSAEYVQQLRRQGITIRNTIDCLIAAWCIDNDVPLLHYDKDFRHYVQFGLTEA